METRRYALIDFLLDPCLVPGSVLGGQHGKEGQTSGIADYYYSTVHNWTDRGLTTYLGT